MSRTKWENEEYSLLMLRVRDDDAGAFEEIVSRFAKVLTNYFYQLCWDSSLSEDLSQETFLKIWNCRKNYKVKASFSTYMFTVALNLWRDEKRKKNRKLVLVDQENINSDIDHSSSPRDDVEKKVEKKFMNVSIKKAIEDLDDKHRQPFVLSEISGLSYEQIAVALEIPVGTVRSRKFNAFRKLKEKLMILIGAQR
ncbi:RNA polymerase sigma factor [bacterium]|nr:RNA polymerase sigma factor [bacterium]